MSRCGLTASDPSAVTDSNPTSNKMAMVDWYSMSMTLWGMMTCTALARSKPPTAWPWAIRNQMNSTLTSNKQVIVDAPVGDIAHQRGKQDGHDGEGDVGQRVVKDGRVQVAEQRRRVCHHDPGIDPVVKVAYPAHAHLGQASVPLVLRALLVQKSGLCEVVAGAGASVRVDPGQFRVAVGRQHGQDQGKK